MDTLLCTVHVGNARLRIGRSTNPFARQSAYLTLAHRRTLLNCGRGEGPTAATIRCWGAWRVSRARDEADRGGPRAQWQDQSA
ncbi:hypothetical protein PsYK624_102460 [Phanerochaete sordida]|uniref:Uncharacterized protein n=1 Tax=Phanerochaete sordida TaxID=48140 RepID=A0A9P3LGR1_9APHY|nr:hypothetical protein PsYK624_102460 [Phanerochaete sordida]